MAAHMQRLQPGQQEDGDKDRENRANPGQQRGLVAQTVDPVRNGAFKDHYVGLIILPSRTFQDLSSFGIISPGISKVNLIRMI